MNKDDAIKGLDALNLDSIRQGLHEYNADLPPQERVRLIGKALHWVDQERRAVQAVLADIDDEDEVRSTLAISYIETKSRWMALNTKINYAVFRHGACATEDAFRGFVTSQLLATIESLLDQEDIDKITSFLAEPVARAA